MKYTNKRVDPSAMRWWIGHLERDGYVVQDINTTRGGMVKNAIFEMKDENGEIIERLTLQPKVPKKFTGSHGWSNLKQIKKDGE